MWDSWSLTILKLSTLHTPTTEELHRCQTRPIRRSETEPQQSSPGSKKERKSHVLLWDNGEYLPQTHRAGRTALRPCHPPWSILAASGRNPFPGLGWDPVSTSPSLDGHLCSGPRASSGCLVVRPSRLWEAGLLEKV